MATVRTRRRGKTFSYIFEAGRTADGRRKVIEKGGFPSKEAAYEAGVAAFTSWKHGDIGITSERVTVKDFLAAWLERIKKDIRSSTHRNYESFIKNDISPFLGAAVLQELTPASLDHWLRILRDRELSQGTIREVKHILSQALDFAVYPCELIKDNPCRYLKTPKTDAGRHVERVIVTAERFHDLLQDLPEGSALRLPLLLLYHTGMRIGEVLGLCWEDIDLDEHSVTICHQRRYDAPLHGEVLTAPKTASSLRKIFLSDTIISTLAENLQQQKQGASKPFHVGLDENGRVYCTQNIKNNLKDLHLVCIRADGAPISRHGLMQFLREHGLNSHSFRHTQATRLAAAGLPPIAVASRLGHANAQTTLSLYTHNTEDQQKEIAARLEEEYWAKFFEL